MEGFKYGPTEPLPGKGSTRCNIMACQCILDTNDRWWNTITLAFYCRTHALRINQNSAGMCVHESVNTLVDLPKLT